MRGLMAAVIGMGVLIVAGVAVLVVLMIQRNMAPVPAPNAGVAALAAEMTMDEPSGTRIAGVSMAGERVAVQLSGGGPDRIAVLDVRTGRVVARAALAR